MRWALGTIVVIINVRESKEKKRALNRSLNNNGYFLLQTEGRLRQWIPTIVCNYQDILKASRIKEN